MALGVDRLVDFLGDGRAVRAAQRDQRHGKGAASDRVEPWR
jgi:hypothetical protein